MRQLGYNDFLKLLEIHQPAKIQEYHIAEAGKETSDKPELVDIVKYYPTIKSRLTGGYVLPSEILPWRFRYRLIFEATETPIYSDPHTMIDELIFNGIGYGNALDEKKVVYLLWHKCPLGKEIYIIDQGENKVDLEEKIKTRRVVSTFSGKDEISATGLLEFYSDGFEYFDVVFDNAKKGTFLRIHLEEKKKASEIKAGEGCEYLGHKLF